MLYVNPLGTQDWARIQAPSDNPAREKAALKELEHFFLYTLLQEMRKTVSIAGETDKSRESSMYTDMLDDALSGAMASSGQLGLAKQIEEQLNSAGMQRELKSAIEERHVKPSASIADKTNVVSRRPSWTPLP